MATKQIQIAWNYPSKNIFELLDEPEYVQPTRTNIVWPYSYQGDRLDNTFGS